MEQKYKNRLRKLAYHMMSFTAEQNAKHFRMRVFLEHNEQELSPLTALAQQVLSACYCNTVACAVGHAPILFPSLMKQFEKECSYWAEDVYLHDDADGTAVYGRKFMKPSYRELSRFLFNIESGSDEFEFLFGGDWDSGSLHDYRSTSWAVADRIMYYLDHPTDFRAVYYGWRYYAARKGLIDESVLIKMFEELDELEARGVQFARTKWDN